MPSLYLMLFVYVECIYIYMHMGLHYDYYAYDLFSYKCIVHLWSVGTGLLYVNSCIVIPFVVTIGNILELSRISLKIPVL